MLIKRPDDTHVYLSLIHLLRQSGVHHPSRLVDCRLVAAISFPTYVVTAMGEAKAMLAALLERFLGREFALADDRWILEAEEARQVAYGAAL